MYSNKESSRFSETLMFILILLLLNNFIITKADKMRKNNKSLEFLQNTVITTTLGILFGLLLHVFDAKTIETTIKNSFEPLFMIILLPTILFSSALKMNQYYFFKNLGTILLFAFGGTLLTISINTLLMYAWTLSGYGMVIPFHYCLVFSTLISATDPVSVLATFEGSQADSNLYSLIFGESIFNDAISLGLYRSILIDEKVSQTKNKFVLDTTARFGLTIIMSTLLGVGAGLLAAYLLKKVNRHTSLSEAQISTMSKILDIPDWEDLIDSENSIESDEKELNVEDDEVARNEEVIVRDEKELPRAYRQSQTKNDAATETRFNQIVNQQAINVSTTTDPGNDNMTSSHIDSQLRAFKQLVSNFYSHLNKEITISIILPLLAYLVAEVT